MLQSKIIGPICWELMTLPIDWSSTFKLEISHDWGYFIGWKYIQKSTNKKENARLVF